MKIYAFLALFCAASVVESVVLRSTARGALTSDSKEEQDVEAVIPTANLADAKATSSDQRELLCKLKRGVNFADIEVVQSSFNRLKTHWGTCAVVSSSGVLRQHNYGAKIDSANLVMRFNDAPVDNFARMVGSRDDFRIVNEQFPGRVLVHERLAYDVQSNASYVVVPMRPPPMLEEFHAKYPSTELYKLSTTTQESVKTALHAIYTDQWFHAGKYQGESSMPTSGAIGLLLALRICDEVRAYGFAQTPSAKLVPYYYFSSETHAGTDASDNSWHNSFDAEKDLWRRLATNTGQSIDETDVVVIPGFSQFNCEGVE